MELSADDGLTVAVFTAEPGSASQQALDLLASWAATPARRRSRSRRPSASTEQHRSTHGVPPPRTHRRPGLEALPRHDDVRRLGQHRPRRLDPHHPRARSTPASTSSTPPTSTRPASPRRSSARRSRAAATTSSWPPSSSCRWATTPTAAAARAAGSSQAVEDSLRRLGTDWIDLYQVHRPDPDTDVDETLGALTDLVRQGKVRYIGSSSFSAGEIVEAQWAARDRRLERFRTEQPPYSLLVRGIELDVLPTAQRHGMGILTYSPLARRLAVGQLDAPTARRPRRPASGSPRASTCRCPRTSASSKPSSSSPQVADDAGLSLIELAIAFVVNHPARDLGDHRPAHDGAAREPAARRRRRARRRASSTASTRSSGPA